MALAAPVQLLCLSRAGLTPQQQGEMAPGCAVLTSPSLPAGPWQWEELLCWKLLPGAASAPSPAAWASPLGTQGTDWPGAGAGGLPKTPGGQNRGSHAALGWKGHQSTSFQGCHDWNYLARNHNTVHHKSLYSH